MKRRDFLRNSALGVGAAVGAGIVGGSGVLHAGEEPKKEKTPLKIKEYRTLGRTGFKASDISAGYVKDPAVLRNLLDAGVNYIDTAESYKNEDVVGDVVKEYDRKKIFITTKMEIKKELGLKKEDFLKRARKSLERLKTDYIDAMLMHSAEELATLKTEGFHQAMDQLKREGKLRYVGVSNHGSAWAHPAKVPMEKILTTAALDGRFDIMLLTYNFIGDNKGAKVLQLLKEKNIGATLMKVNPVGNLPRMRKRLAEMKKDHKRYEFAKNWVKHLEAQAALAADFIKKHKLDDPKRMRDAAIKFALSNPNVHTVCCGFHNFDLVDAYLPLSGTRLDAGEKTALNLYKQGCGHMYCRHACGECESACPHNVPVNTILRYNHYFEAQGKEKFAMKSYYNLKAPKADLCANCAGHCQAACPYGVPAQGMLNLAHHTLSLA